MKKLILVLLIISISGLAVFADDVMKIEIGKFKIQLPVTWMIQYTESTYVFFIYAATVENDTFQENASLVVEQLAKKMSINDYRKAAIDQLTPYYEDFKIVESKDNYVIISGTINGVSVKQIQYYYINNKEAYILTFSSIPEDFDSYISDFKSIAASFTYK
jgi:hypothetical protein